MSQTFDTYRRQFRRFDIVSRRKRSEFGVASDTDFELSFSGYEVPATVRSGMYPYCFNFMTERIIYTDLSNLEGLFSGAFLYIEQYKRATHVVSVPFELSREIEEDFTTSPSFIFSIGRCGSTLMSRIMRSGGIKSASEPDTFTQLADVSNPQRKFLDRSTRDLLIRVSASSIVRLCNDAPVIKLRSHCNDIAPDIFRNCPSGRFFFMLRDAASWARSRYLAFGTQPKELAHLLKAGVVQLDRLFRSGCAPSLIWYNDLVQDPAGIFDKLKPDGVATPTDLKDRIASVMMTDAQEGTGISRNRKLKAKMPDEFMGAFQSEWHSVRPTELLKKHGLWEKMHEMPGT